MFRQVKGIDTIMEQKENYEALKLENQFCFPLYACARKVMNQYTPYLKPLGITYTQYLVFMVLWEKDGISAGELCQKLYLDSGTVTPLLKKMEAAGFLYRTRSSEDERVVIIHLTQKGIELKEQAKEIPMKMKECMPLSVEEAKSVYEILYKILNTK